MGLRGRSSPVRVRRRRPPHRDGEARRRWQVLRRPHPRHHEEVNVFEKSMRARENLSFFRLLFFPNILFLLLLRAREEYKLSPRERSARCGGFHCDAARFLLKEKITTSTKKRGRGIWNDLITFLFAPSLDLFFKLPFIDKTLIFVLLFFL